MLLMALWQYTFRLIPKVDLEELGVSTCISNEVLDDFVSWSNGNYTLAFFKPLTAILESNKIWCENINLFGTEDSNCIEIFMDNGKVVEVTVRLDYQTEYTPLLHQLIEFCSLNSIVLLDEENNVLYLNTTKITQVILSSPQYKKLNNLKSKSS
jgi:hypothetical protein